MGVILYNNPDFQKALNEFGVSAANLVNAKNIKAKELLSNPQQMASIAPAYRRAKAAGAGDTFLAGLGVDPSKFAPYLDAYEPTNAERYDTALGAGGGPEAKAGAEIATDTVATRTANAQLKGDVPEKQAAAAGASADVTTETANQTLMSGLIHARINADVKDAISKGRELDAGLIAGLPEEEVGAKINDIKSKNAENQFNASIFRRRSAAGIDRLTVDTERMKAITDQMGLGLKSETLSKYKNYMDTLDPKSDEYKAMVLGAENPEALRHYQFHEELGVSTSLALAKINKDSIGDKLAATAKVSDQIQSGIKDLNAMVKAGESPDVIATQKELINNWRSISQDAQEHDLIYPMSTIGAEDKTGFLGGKKGIQLFNEDVKSTKVRDILNAIGSGQATMDQLSEVDPQTKQSAMSLLTPLEREELTKNLPTMMQKKADIANGKMTPAQAARPASLNKASLQAKLDTLTELRDNLDKPVKGTAPGMFRPGTAETLGLTTSVGQQKATLDKQIDMLKQQLAIISGQ